MKKKSLDSKTKTNTAIGEHNSKHARTLRVGQCKVVMYGPSTRPTLVVEKWSGGAD